MSDERFQEQYIPTDEEHIYKAKASPRRIVELTDNIRMMAPWGTLQYAKRGDMIVYVNQKDIHAVPRRLFDETYIIIEE